ncbi:hypothetical protein LNQ49_10090 [Flavobacterium sp. F-65]|jgi:hypothetical protein|uniref:Uncharacterized protein n=1 Tax=Flavobacterium pisciphilum TaxID=2893755 RepID=A0ABS8MT24_9FLAO|nr:hypothetical protein [Flavobacterium sp. F-65]MCC9071930.1 hypothetical protein [Flavobacterium sp. F-65]
MSTQNYLAKRFGFFKFFRTKKSTIIQTTNELADSRFGMETTDETAGKKAPNSLLFLMYSTENETLFI